MLRTSWKGNVGRSIRRRRLAIAMTQERAAESFGCTLRHWQRLEEGTQNPSLLVLVRIARALGTKPHKLLE